MPPSPQNERSGTEALGEIEGYAPAPVVRAGTLIGWDTGGEKVTTDGWDRDAWSATEARLTAELLLWHSHGGFTGHTHFRGSDWHVHRQEQRGKHVAWLTVWEDGEVVEGHFDL